MPVIPPAVVAQAPAPTPAPAPAIAKAAPLNGAAIDSKTVVVKAGDTASRIASAHLISGVSLDQMLVAMTKANPRAFVEGNVNRLKAGAVLEIPGQADASAVSAQAARQEIQLQAANFDAYRRKLAGLAAGTSASQGRTASGTIQTRVAERNAAPKRPDKLSISSGAISGYRAEDQRVMAERLAIEAAKAAKLAEEIKALTPAAPASRAASQPQLQRK
ncbi:MAG: FimV/HubP family polar landmark protein [Ramlibacter sp.]|nr:FimV/HubP family polar landmark protein [Ramlibacter sp.]